MRYEISIIVLCTSSFFMNQYENRKLLNGTLLLAQGERDWRVFWDDARLFSFLTFDHHHDMSTSETRLALPAFLKMLTADKLPMPKAMAIAGKV